MTDRSGFVGRTYETITEEVLPWAWEGVFPRKMLSAIVGDPGLGKSLFMCDLAARFTCGWSMPCGGKNGFGEPVNVLILASEDNVSTTIKPRLRKAGADMSRVYDLSDEQNFPPVLPRDAAKLASYIRANKVRAIFIDPVTDFVGGIDLLSNDQVRKALAALASIASEFDAMALMAMHLNKAEGKRTINRVTDSKAFVNMPRAVWIAAPDPEEAKHIVLVPLKTNLSPSATSYGYEIEKVPEGRQPRVLWDDEPGQFTIRELEEVKCGYPKQPQSNSKLAEAKFFLAALLRDGQPLDSREVKRLGKEEGHKEITLKRAAADMGVQSTRSETMPSYTIWRWPQDQAPALADLGPARVVA